MELKQFDNCFPAATPSRQQRNNKAQHHRHHHCSSLAGSKHYSNRASKENRQKAASHTSQGANIRTTHLVRHQSRTHHNTLCAVPYQNELHTQGPPTSQKSFQTHHNQHQSHHRRIIACFSFAPAPQGSQPTEDLIAAQSKTPAASCLGVVGFSYPSNTGFRSTPWKVFEINGFESKSIVFCPRFSKSRGRVEKSDLLR